MPPEPRTSTLGVIADDYTGATDVASGLLRSGMRTSLHFGVPERPISVGDAEAVVVALKTRNAPVADAVRDSLEVQRALRQRGIRHLYFKYCSTFDSTDEGNIGPVADALRDAARLPLAVVCPSTPEHGRTVYQGHLFVGSHLLSESPMREHPLTPMRDSSLVRLLRRQTPHKVALVSHEQIRRGPRALASTLERLARRSVRHVVVDAITDDDLRSVAQAAYGTTLLTGGAGLARLVASMLIEPYTRVPHRVDLPAGPLLILSGSLSPSTRRQVRAAARVLDSFCLDAAGVASAIAWLDANGQTVPRMVYSSDRSEVRDRSEAAAIEVSMGQVARHAVAAGVRRLVVAGGETAGAVLQALGINRAIVASEEDPGVPWLVTMSEPPLALLLKSGNFGAPDLFVRVAR